jgi:hypothetical protein
MPIADRPGPDRRKLTPAIFPYRVTYRLRLKDAQRYEKFKNQIARIQRTDFTSINVQTIGTAGKCP